MKVARLLACCALILLAGCAPPWEGRGWSHIVIGAKNFTEQVVLGELLAQHIEARTGVKVERRFYLAGSYICQQALQAGRIDGYVEYTGTALTAILKQPMETDAARVRATTSALYETRYQVRQFPSLGFENTFAMVVRPGSAAELKTAVLSDAVQAAAKWRLGVGYEFEQRPDGLPRLLSVYGMRFDGQPRTMDLGLLYRALAANQVDIIAANSTDGPIQAMHLTVLADDKHAFPPYEAVPLFREQSLQRWPQLAAAVNELAGKISADDMRAMNEAVDGEHRPVEDVVREFRQKRGL
jgi:osmoprotectant transport system substrate-binding protein